MGLLKKIINLCVLLSVVTLLVYIFNRPIYDAYLSQSVSWVQNNLLPPVINWFKTDLVPFIKQLAKG